MIIKINQHNPINSRLNSTKTVEYSGPTFLETLNTVANNSTSTKTSSEGIAQLQDDTKTTGIQRIDKLAEGRKGIVLKAIDSLDHILDINILQNKDEFFNEDSQIKIRDILDGYGDHVTSNEMTDLGKTINVLMDNGMISNDDYFYALKWMAMKAEQFSVKLQNEDTKFHSNFINSSIGI